MRTTTEFLRINCSVTPFHRINLHNIWILFPKRSLYTTFSRLIFWLFRDDRIKSRCDSVIHIIFHCFDFFGCHLCRMSKVKTKSLRCNIGSCLMHMISENFSKSSEHNVSCRVKRCGIITTIS